MWFRRRIAADPLGTRSTGATPARTATSTTSTQPQPRLTSRPTPARSTPRAPSSQRRDYDDTFVARFSNGTEETIDIRTLVLHMIEEYARHNGHADLLREAIDGATGE